MAPLYNGNKHSNTKKWNKDSDFESDQLTGLQLKLGKQADGTYLCALDFDKLSKDFSGRIESVIQERPDMYWERSSSGGYHYIFKTNEDPNIYGTWNIKGATESHGKMELLYADDQTVNIAPTSSYVDRWEFSGEPVYGSSEKLCGDIQIYNRYALLTPNLPPF